ncbi:MAG TPA: hypothetical protein PKV67_01135 [Hyphomonas sp.]|nr:hypothetical protein [Hyphomonas sp.]
MSGIIATILANPTVLAVLAGIAAVIAAIVRGRRAGAAAERAKQAEAERKARTIADEVDNDIGAIPPSKARKELKEWSPDR